MISIYIIMLEYVPGATAVHIYYYSVGGSPVRSEVRYRDVVSLKVCAEWDVLLPLENAKLGALIKKCACLSGRLSEGFSISRDRKSVV